jgi:hypothetical protein
MRDFRKIARLKYGVEAEITGRENKHGDISDMCTWTKEYSFCISEAQCIREGQ